MSEDRLLNATSRAARAQQLLNDDLVIEAYSGIEASLIAAWIASDPRDTEGRERCFTAVHANRKHKDAMRAFVTNGVMAQAELKRLVEMAEYKKRFGA